MRQTRVLAVMLGVLVLTLTLGAHRTAQAQGDPADDDICAFLNAQGETLFDDGFNVTFATDARAFGSDPGPDGFIEGTDDFFLPSGLPGGNDDVPDPRNDMDAFMPGGAGCSDGLCDTMDYDETGPDAGAVAIPGDGTPAADPLSFVKRLGGKDGGAAAGAVTPLRACDDAAPFPGTCASPHGSYSYADLYTMNCSEGSSVGSPCTAGAGQPGDGVPAPDAAFCGESAGCSGPIGVADPICLCAKSLLTRGYLNGSLSAITETVQDNELIGVGTDATVAITGATLNFTTDEVHRIDVWIEDAGPDGRPGSGDERAECVGPAPIGAANGFLPGEDGMTSWITPISTDLPLVAGADKVHWRLGNARPNFPDNRIFRATGDLMLKTSDGAGSGVGAYVGNEVWFLGWFMPITEWIACERSNRFANGNLPNIVLDQFGVDGIGMGAPGDNGDAIIYPGTGVCTYMNQFVRQIQGLDKSVDVLAAYFTVFTEVSPETMTTLTSGAINQTGFFQQYIVGTSTLLEIDACGLDVNDTSGCPVGTPRMAGGRCTGNGQICLSDAFCADRGEGTCNRNINLSGPFVRSGLVIPGSDGN